MKTYIYLSDIHANYEALKHLTTLPEMKDKIVNLDLVVIILMDMIYNQMQHLIPYTSSKTYVTRVKLKPSLEITTNLLSMPPITRMHIIIGELMDVPTLWKIWEYPIVMMKNCVSN